MKVSEYDEFVRSTDQSIKRKPDARRAIAYYGLIGELGSVVSSIKKQLLAEGGESAWDQPNEEIKEEIGDALWYCFSLAHIVNDESFDILANDIAQLRQEIGSTTERAEQIRAALNPESRKAFLLAAQEFPPPQGYSFDDYQRLAFKTARTDGRTLLDVCLAVLTQLGAELLRATLPAIELSLNKNIADRHPNAVLGEVCWHLAAISSLYHLSLDEVINKNCKKVSFRATRGDRTPLHDDNRASEQQLPRWFEIAFVRVGAGRSRMYFEGHRLGDDLTDNANEDDGYRFHDVMHLALLAHLGWSPVIRGFMKRKRPDIDDVEDGGRAKVVEELVLKAIHSTGEHQAIDRGRCAVDGPTRLFPERSAIPFNLLKTIHGWVDGLEVKLNKYWEWEDAIFDGCEIFYLLRIHKQGTVAVDLVQRKLTFRPTVVPGVSGITVGMGMGVASHDEADHGSVLSEGEREIARASGLMLQTVAVKKAIFQALDMPLETPWNQLQVQVLDRKQVSVNASGEVQQRLWARRAVDFKVALVSTLGQLVATVAVIADGGER